MNTEKEIGQTHETVYNYRLLKTIGSGNYGTVKKCCNIYTGEIHAIKFIEKTRITKAAQTVRLKREIALMSVLDHPNIAKVYGAFETDTAIAIIMEYVEGMELFELIHREKKLAEQTAMPLFRSLAEALAYLHSHNVIHRDIKPENMIVSPDRKSLKLIDFGFATLFHPQKEHSTNCGSPLYASPEIVRGMKYVGPEVDVWSAGVVLFAMLHGRLPFDDKETKRVYAKICRGVFFADIYTLSVLAVDLLKTMLQIDVPERATYRSVLQHPWLGLGGTSVCYCHEARDSRLSLEKGRMDQRILRQMQEFPGYEDDIENQHAVARDCHSPQNALYCLLLDRHVRKTCRARNAGQAALQKPRTARWTAARKNC